MTVKKFIIINIGLILVAFSFSLFLDSKNIVTGGVTGLSIVINNIFKGLDSSLFVLIINIIILIIAFFTLNIKFFLNSIYGSIALPIYIFIMNKVLPYLNIYIDDMFLIIIFSSVLIGVGIGLVLRNNSSTGGVDIIQSILFKYFHISYSVSLYVIDFLIILLGYLVFKNMEVTLYSFIFVFISGYIIDVVIYGGFNKKSCFIISDKKDDIKDIIISKINRGVTEINVTGGYLNNDKVMLLCVLYTNEYIKLRQLVEKIDPNSFMFVSKATEVRGLGFTIEEEK